MICTPIGLAPAKPELTEAAAEKIVGPAAGTAPGSIAAFFPRLPEHKVYSQGITEGANHNHPSNGWFAQGLKAQ